MAEQEIIPPGTDIALYVAETPANMFQVKTVPELLFAKIEAEVAAFKPDLSTQASRQEIASLAFKIARTKAAVDKAGLDLTEDFRKAVTTINSQRNAFKTRFQELQDRARKPLDDWMAAEETRKKAADAIMADLRNSAIVDINETAASVRERIARVTAITLDFAVLGAEYAISAPHIKETTLKALKEAYARLVKSEADAARLAELEAAENARKEAEVARAREAEEAAETARREEQARLDEEARQAELAEAEERGKKAAAEAAAAAEAERLEDERKEREAVEAENLRRQQDAEHRDKVVSSAAIAIRNLTGLSLKKSIELVLHVAGDGVPHMKVEF